MQTVCPGCNQPIVVDDSKLPAGPFMLRCPKCKTMTKVPGKVEARQPTVAPPPVPSNGKPPSPPAEPPVEKQPGEASPVPQTGPELAQRALIALQNAGQGKLFEAILGRQGYSTEELDGTEEQLIQLQTGDYRLVVADRNGASAPVDIYRMVSALAPEVRRRLFLVLVGDELKTGNGTQAFAAMADFVCNSKETESAEALLRSTIAEKSRLYHTFLEVERPC